MKTGRFVKTKPLSPVSTEEIVEKLVGKDVRVLLFGQPGVGKSTLAAELGRTLDSRGRSCWCIGADPGSPAFGIPGAVSLGYWDKGHWQISAFEPLCTLDAGRFRLPLVTAIRRLSQSSTEGIVLIDSPGLVRGVSGSELLFGLAEATKANTVLVIASPNRPLPLLAELNTLAAEILIVRPSPYAKRPGKRLRARYRTRLWETYLSNAVEQQIDLQKLNIIGTPPPAGEKEAWTGRQIALLSNHQTVSMGEVLGMVGTRLTIKAPALQAIPDAIVIRDALRTTNGVIETAVPFANEKINYLPPSNSGSSGEESGGPSISTQVGPADAAMVNGIFDDPLLHLRLRNQGRSLFFDLGDSSRLPARIAHQVTDVFISHAHMDHISGFQWLLRSRMGGLPSCRIYGPPGLASHIEGFLQGFLWDRIGENGPSFEVLEIHGERLRRFRLQAGLSERMELNSYSITDGILRKDPDFQIRTIMLDHKTPVAAYAFEPVKKIRIRKDRLADTGWKQGPWLAELKIHLQQGNPEAMIHLPDGSKATAGELSARLIQISPGKKLVYATDLADTPDNRERLVAFARNAHTFFCESPFIQEDADHARRTGHLTTLACGEIATAAGVARLAPFHFSRRYANRPQQVFAELKAACNRVIIPYSMSTHDL